MKIKSVLFCIFSIIIIQNLYAQDDIKWGKISKEEIELTECEFDKDASAVIIFSKGEMSFSDTKVVINKHFRIKILKDQGKEYANQYILYYSEDNMEKIINIKAQTINIDNEGTIQKQKLIKTRYLILNMVSIVKKFQ